MRLAARHSKVVTRGVVVGQIARAPREVKDAGASRSDHPHALPLVSLAKGVRPVDHLPWEEAACEEAACAGGVEGGGGDSGTQRQGPMEQLRS